jgi:hypothetical protein
VTYTTPKLYNTFVQKKSETDKINNLDLPNGPVVNSIIECTGINQGTLATITASRSWVFVDCTNVDVSMARFVGSQNSWAVFRPDRKFTIRNTSFIKLSLGTQSSNLLAANSYHHNIRIFIEPPRMTQRRKPYISNNVTLHGLKFSIFDTVFRGIDYLPRKIYNSSNYPAISVCSKHPLKGWHAHIVVRNSMFKRCSMIAIDAVEDRGLHINITNCSVNGMVKQKEAKEWQRSRGSNMFNGSAVRVHLTNYFVEGVKEKCSVANKSPPGFNIITILGCKFTNLTSKEGTALLIHTVTLVSCPASTMMVDSNRFEWNYGTFFRSVLYAQDHRVGYSNRENLTGVWYRIILKSNLFWKNFRAVRSDMHCIIYQRDPVIINYWHERKNKQHYNGNYKQICNWQAVIYLSQYTQQIRVLMDSNTIKDNLEGGLHLVDSSVQFRGRNIINKSEASYGGGIKILGNSQLLLEENSLLEIVSNKAYIRSGGLFIQDLCTIHQTAPGTCQCFFHFSHQNGSSMSNFSKESLQTFNASVRMSGNIAGNGRIGSASIMFNSNIDQCKMDSNSFNGTSVFDYIAQKESNLQVFEQVFNVTRNHVYNSSEISSIPRRLCLCKDSMRLNATCNLNSLGPVDHYPGQKLKLSVSLQGDMDILLSSVLYVQLRKRGNQSEESDTNVDFFASRNSELGLYSTHYLNNICNSLILPSLPHVDPPHRFNLQLRVPLLRDTLIEEDDTTYLVYMIRTNALPGCPRCFVEMSHSCKCHPKLVQFGFSCSLDNLTVSPPKNKTAWIGQSSRDGKNTQWSMNCPYVYCSSKNLNQIPLDNFDIQCKHNRIGKLCGQCPAGQSAVLLSNECKVCTNTSLLIILGTLLAGPILVVIIGLLNLTITVGAINGYMYYLVVIYMSADIFDSHDTGICVLNGLDQFGKWLFAYLFPIYLLAFVGIACCLPKCKCKCVYRRMHTINQMIGPRITPVLATVVTISYLTITGNVIGTFQYTPMYSTDGTTTLVWLYDGSLAFFQSPKHAILGCIGLLMLLLFVLPAAVVATAGDLLRRFIKGPFYMNFLDTFHGAHRFKFGFWFGVRLLVLTIIMVFKVVLEPRQTQLAIVCTSSAILIFQVIAKPYKGIRISECVPSTVKAAYFMGTVIQQNITNFLDNTFHINLMVVFAAILYSPSVQLTAFAISQTVASSEFFVIIVYHTLEYTRLGQLLIELQRRIKRRYKKWQEVRAMRARALSDSLQQTVIVNDIELRLEDCWNDSGENSQYDNDSNSTNDHPNITNNFPATISSGYKEYAHKADNVTATNTLMTPLLIAEPQVMIKHHVAAAED